ncbi:MAG: ATP-binding protein [Candidatus Omnitrophota bacterium]
MVLKQAEKYRDLVDIIPGVVYIAELPDLNIIYINKRVEEYLGFNQADWLLSGISKQKQIYPEDIEKVNAALKRTEKTGGFFESVYRMIHKDRTTVKWFKDIAVITRDEKTGGNFITGVMTDITDLKLRELENERLSGVVRDISEMVFIMDMNCRVIYSNPSALFMSGYDEQDIKDKSIEFFLAEITPPLFVEELDRKICSGEKWDGEIIFKRKDGGFFPVLLRLEPLKDNNDQITGMIGVGMDITQRRLLEDEIRRYTQHLEKIVEIRTGDLRKTFEELKEANDKLRRYDMLKSEFVAKVAHELINPLCMASESIKIVNEGKLGNIETKQKEILEMSRKEITRLLRFITDMLDLSKIEAGKMPMKKEEVDVKKLLNEILAYFKNECVRKKVSMDVEIKDVPVHIRADKDLVKQIFLNLISNSLRYTSLGKKAAFFAGKEDGDLRVEIRDQGPGIPKQEQDRIFDKFYRIFEDRETGTGLGLSIAKEIVDLHRGKIWVESEEGKGSSFIVILPV